MKNDQGSTLVGVLSRGAEVTGTGEQVGDGGWGTEHSHSQSSRRNHVTTRFLARNR